MKKLLFSQVIVTMATIGIFSLTFYIQGGWGLKNMDKYSVIPSAAFCSACCAILFIIPSLSLKRNPFAIGAVVTTAATFIAIVLTPVIVGIIIVTGGMFESAIPIGIVSGSIVILLGIFFAVVMTSEKMKITETNTSQLSKLSLSVSFFVQTLLIVGLILYLFIS